MTNGASKTPSGGPDLIVPPPLVPEVPALMCHKFFVQMAIPQPDRLDPRKANIVPQVANIQCIKEKCMLWNEAENECWEKTAFKAQALQGEWAHAQRNDVSIPGGGA
jgi:hypothetical protein